MAKVKAVLRHLQAEVADRKRKCHRNPKKHVIAKGEACLGIYEGSPGRRRNYCLECAAPILEAAADSLAVLRRGLGFAVPLS